MSDTDIKNRLVLTNTELNRQNVLLKEKLTEKEKTCESLYPNIKILFMSGYSANVIVNRGVLEQGVNFIQKPYSLKDLAVKVRDAL
jgi:hypothetical protein